MNNIWTGQDPATSLFIHYLKTFQEDEEFPFVD